MDTSSTPAATSGAASIVKTLGTGSGLDTSAIVAGLVEASFATKNRQLTAKADALTAQISGLAKLKSGLTGLDTALRTLVQGGSLSTQPTSSATSVLTATATGSASLVGLNARLTVGRLAAAQAATTNVPVARTEPFRSGALNVTIGGVVTAITIDPADATLTGIAAKINAAGLGLTASVVSDGSGARLTVKGQTGAANAFTIEGVDTDPAATGLSLSDLSVGAGATGTTIGVTAADAEVTLDGATYTRATNGITDLIPGVRLELQGVGATTLGATAPTANLNQAVTDFVSAYNELRATVAAELDPQGGELRNDPSARNLLRSLGTLTITSLAPNGDDAPRTLADIGVRTARDGSLSVDTARLSRMLSTFPDAVEKMFARGTGATDGGLSAALSAIVARATDPEAGLDAVVSRYQDAQDRITDAQAATAAKAEAMTERLTRQFAGMDARVAAYKSTQNFLKQQVDAWYRG
jgi:flagellar hook-associated protein 2